MCSLKTGLTVVLIVLFAVFGVIVMNVELLKYHVLRCPKCGNLRSSTARSKTRCIKCMHGWEIHKNGNTWGVLASFYTPAQATSFIQQYKQKLADMRVPANEDIKSAFSILGLEQNCTREQFVTEYRKRAMLYHPDVNQNNEIAKEHFHQITTAAHQIRNIMGWY